MTSIDAWGPFASGLSACEFIARCRTLRACAHILAGQRTDALCTALQTAESEPWMIHEALTTLNRLASLDRRRILASFGALTCPRWNG